MALAVPAVAGAVLGLPATGGRPAAAATPAAVTLAPGSFQLRWSLGLDADQGAPVAEGSPTVAHLDGGGPAVVFGDRSGELYAYHLSDGSPVPGWPVNVGAPVDSTPSVSPGPGGLDDVFVGSGDAAEPNGGGFRAFGPDGKPLWSTNLSDPAADPHPASGVAASPAVVPAAGGPAVFAATLGQEAALVGTGDGRPRPGWPFYTADSTFSTAAVADLYGTGQADLVVGGASTAGFALGQNYPQGGHVRILSAEGALVCHRDFDQEVDSSPAVGPVLAGGGTGIVVGTGSYWPGASDTDTVVALDTSCHRVWTARLDGATGSSPALADVAGDGHMDVVEGTDSGSGGSVWVLDAADGSVHWHVPVTGRVIGSVVTADLAGGGYQDLLVPTTHGLDVIDGRSRSTVAVLSQGGYQNAPLVTVDPDGAAGITIAGYNGQNVGVVFHYEVAGSSGTRATGAGSWPMFHHDPRLSGVETSSPLAAVPPCVAPAAARSGYDLVASDGGLFAFGPPFCGSTGGIALARPVVAMTRAPVTGGYWLVASDGGVFAFGGARFHGSTGSVHLALPIVGAAATPDGGGYWLVAADGGVFAFGDAPYLGSAAGIRLRSPVVGMAATGDGRGYWLVTATGDVYSFGDARYQGSAGSVRLARPVVAIALDRGTGGYWLVASDGGVFGYGAPFLGSTGGIRLARPVVAISVPASGAGYWLVASDGGVFAFGAARFHGSTGGVRLSRPVVGASGFSG